jgi:hypothetical protein
VNVLASDGTFPNIIFILAVFAAIALVAWMLLTFVMVGLFAGVANLVRRVLSRDRDDDPWDAPS